MSSTTDRPIKIAAISGSLRRDSYNTALLRVAAAIAPDDVEVEIAKISDLPMYNRDDEVADGFPRPVSRLRDAVGAADGLLIASPEYNYSITGALKNALDWLSRSPAPVDRIPLAMLSGAGRLGGVRSLAHLRDIVRHNDMQVVDKPEVLVTGVSSKFDAGGNFIDDRAADQIRRLLEGLRRKVIEARRISPRVLVVARDEDFSGKAFTTLKTEGYRPVPARSDDEALEYMKSRPFEVVLIGGGVESESRDRLTALAADLNITVASATTSGTLLEAVQSTLESPSPFLRP